MVKTQIALSLFLTALMLVCAPDISEAKKHKNKMGKDRVGRDFKEADKDGDKRLSPSEWMRRGNFARLDRNADGHLSLKEVRFMYKGHDDKDYDWPPKGMATPKVKIDPSIAADLVGKDQLDKQTLCGIGRSKKCDLDPQIKRGLLETGTGPRFPQSATCPNIDDYWAMDYASKRNQAAFHGGIDLPVPWGTPMIAAAAGSVVTIFDGTKSKRGIELVLRHSPEQTGLSMWTYTAYGHLDTMPDLKIGQRVSMGQIIGPTGNSGISAKGSKQSTTRRPAIHFVVFYSPVKTYAEVNRTIIPVDGRWMDPMAFYRQKEPFESSAVKALPDSEKDVDIPILFKNGTTLPADTKMVWPYMCTRN